VAANPFTSFSVSDAFTFSGVQQLFLLGAVAIGVGVYTYSKKVMLTVGGGLFPLSPVGAWVVVVAQSIVLFLFASQGLEHLLASNGLPTIPLVPVSSSQAVVGAVIGIGLLKGGKGIKWSVLGHIASGWVITPLVAGLVCFVALFFLQNVFNQQVYHDASYVLSEPVLDRLKSRGFDVKELASIKGQRFDRVRDFRAALRQRLHPGNKEEMEILDIAQIDIILINNSKLWLLDKEPLLAVQRSAMWRIVGRKFEHRWMVDDALAGLSEAWRPRPHNKANKLCNKKLAQQRKIIYDTFRIP